MGRYFRFSDDELNELLYRPSSRNGYTFLLVYFSGIYIQLLWENENREPLLHRACYNFSVGCVEYLIGLGADINAKDKDGYTAIHHVARYDNWIEFVKALVTNGADVNAQDNFGMTPLDTAMLFKNSAAIEYLSGIIAASSPDNH